jgi:hypothetical protein
MFGSKVPKEEPGLIRLQKDIARDRLRLQQRVGLVDGDDTVEETPRVGASGRLYQVFVAMGEA